VEISPVSVVGGDEVEAYGGQVKIAPYVPGVSTTKLIENISNTVINTTTVIEVDETQQ
jgi:bifunctional ADP-heptose synthase (sugar kinase/adenylyltransferase)